MKKKTWKRVIALCTVFVMLLTAAPVYAKKQEGYSAEFFKKLTVAFRAPYEKNDLMAVGSITGMGQDKVKVKSSNPSVARVVRDNKTGNYASFSAKPVKPGKATFYITPEGKKTYVIKITVIKYQNPVEYVKVGDTVIKGSDLDRTGNVNLSYDKFAGKNIKFVMKAINKDGWNIKKSDVIARSGSGQKPYMKELGKNGTFKLSGKKGTFQITMYLKNPQQIQFLYFTITFK